MNAKLYKSKRWEILRERILRRDKYMCQYSKRYGKLVPATMVHHIFPVEDYPQYAFEPWNLISLCDKAHDKMHDRNHDKLSAEGAALMRRVATAHGIEVDG